MLGGSWTTWGWMRDSRGTSEGQWWDMRVTEVVSGAGLKFGQPRKKFRLSLDVGVQVC